MAKSGLRHPDWDDHFSSASLVKLHRHPAQFLAELIRDVDIPIDRRRNLAAHISTILPDQEQRAAFFAQHASDRALDPEVSITLRLFAGRLGDRRAFGGLVEEIGTLPIDHAATAIALFGHYPERGLAERAAQLMRGRSMTPQDIVRVANSVDTGMRHVFEMDFGFGGAVRSAPPHPGIAAWRDVLDDWASREDFSPQERLSVLDAAADLGSDHASAELERTVLAIVDFDAPEWRGEHDSDHVLSSALRRMQKQRPVLPMAFIERILGSQRYNIATRGIDALQSIGDEAALQRLIDLHATSRDWHVRDTIANTIELMAARLGRAVTKVDRHYRLVA